jgi:uncharacterized protein
MNVRCRAARPAVFELQTWALFALALLIVLASTLATYALTFPQLSGRVVDEAGILDQAARAALESKLAGFETRTTGQFVVVTLKSLQGTSIEDYGYQLGRHWGIGQKGKNSGVMLIVVPSERRVRIEVGYGLEGQLTDAVSRLIIENAIVPRFRAGDYAGGINRAVDDIIQVLNDPEEWRLRAKRQRPDHQSGSIDIFTIVLFLIVAILVIRAMTQAGGPPGAAGRRNRSVFLPTTGSWGSGSSGSSDWSSGSSWGDSGGGFSGGGGSFGGGGASGSW